MKIVNIDLKNNNKIKSPVVACLGFFDGLHLGHQKLIEETLKQAKLRNYQSLFFTFSQSPKLAINNESNCNIILSLQQKQQLIHRKQFNYFAIFEFNDQSKKLTKEEFITILKKLNIKVIIVGEDFRFGYKRVGTISDLKEHFEVIIKSAVFYNSQKVSTTYIKQLLLSHQIEVANSLLMKPFSIEGQVHYGNQWGRKINFPTINFHLNSQFNLLPTGIYITSLFINNKKYYGLTCIIEIDNILKCETHILEYDGNLYCKNIIIYFLHFIRNNLPIKDLEHLKQLILEDKRKTLLYLKNLKE